jgi:8-oxo-dGTP pyrophosphatase MutT (NUDIX family)
VAPSHSAFIVVYRSAPGGKKQFLVMDYQSTSTLTGRLSGKDVRFPGGVSKPGESSEETCLRKLKEETGLIARKIKWIEREPVRGHHKHCFVVALKDCRGNLRTSILRVRGDVMSPPRWEDAGDLDNLLAPVHRWIYDAAWEELC